VADRIRLGNAELSRVVEWQVGGLSVELFPQTPAEAWHELAAEYNPTFWSDAGWRIALQTWVVGVDGLTVLVDTGAGNDRDRPAMPPLDHLNTDFRGSLRAAGVEPDAVDVVINTHIHSDHVGWNTMRDGDAWVPTFPNARYVMPEADYRYFHPDNAAARPAHRGRRRPTGRLATHVRGQHLSGRGGDRAVGRRPSTQRVALAAPRARTHAGVVGGVAGCG
jgi:glyoxylase-like metal-dependent hydrolase (beta-lactamase superfamily II)